MITKLHEKLKQPPGSRQKKIEKRAKQLILEEMSLRDLRNAMELTQEAVAKELHIRQDGQDLKNGQIYYYRHYSNMCLPRAEI